jgi:hypothetical protein
MYEHNMHKMHNCMSMKWYNVENTQTAICAVQAFQVTMEAYWKEYLFLGALMAGYIIAAYIYGVTTYNAWSLLFYCLCHLAGPILLSPAITSLAY